MDITETEKNILYCLINGDTNIKIAESVGYSERNVIRKIKQLCKIFKVNSRYALIREAVIAKSRGLI